MLALHYAIESLDLDAVRTLLEQGVEVNAGNPSLGLATALHVAVDIECEDACRRYDNGDPDAEPIPVLTSLLLQYGADPTVSDAAGGTPRDWASERNYLAALRLFDARK